MHIPSHSDAEFSYRTMPFRRTPSKHILAIATGILWYNVEPIVFALMHPEASVAAHACSTLGVMTTVYESTWRPRWDPMATSLFGGGVWDRFVLAGCFGGLFGIALFWGVVWDRSVAFGLSNRPPFNHSVSVSANPKL